MIVVDASVLANVVGDDTAAGGRARARLAAASTASVPDLADVETVSTLRRRWLAGDLAPERFEQAIDRAAMKGGMDGTDDYLAEWRKAEPYAVESDLSDLDVAQSEAARLDAEFDQDRIKALIANDGWA